MTFPPHPRSCHGYLHPVSTLCRVAHVCMRTNIDTRRYNKLASLANIHKKWIAIQYPVQSRYRGRNRRYNIVSRPGYFNEYKRANCDFTPPGLTWLFIQTQTTTLLPTNQNRRLSTPRKWAANTLPRCVLQEKGGPGRANQRYVWLRWKGEGGSQWAACLRLRGGSVRPMGSQFDSHRGGEASAEAQWADQCCLPVPGTGGEDPLQPRKDRTVNPETVHTEANGRHRWVRGCEARPGAVLPRPLVVGRGRCFENVGGGIRRRDERRPLLASST